MMKQNRLLDYELSCMEPLSDDLPLKLFGWFKAAHTLGDDLEKRSPTSAKHPNASPLVLPKL